MANTSANPPALVPREAKSRGSYCQSTIRNNDHSILLQLLTIKAPVFVSKFDSKFTNGGIEQLSLAKGTVEVDLIEKLVQVSEIRNYDRTFVK